MSIQTTLAHMNHTGGYWIKTITNTIKNVYSILPKYFEFLWLVLKLFLGVLLNQIRVSDFFTYLYCHIHALTYNIFFMLNLFGSFTAYFTVWLFQEVFFVLSYDYFGIVFKYRKFTYPLPVCSIWIGKACVFTLF